MSLSSQNRSAVNEVTKSMVELRAWKFGTSTFILTRHHDCLVAVFAELSTKLPSFAERKTTPLLAINAGTTAMRPP
jgi:hypothetical protein